jgi:hypothetical protein
MEPWALRARRVRELEQELSVVLDDADCRAAGFTRMQQRRLTGARSSGAFRMPRWTSFGSLCSGPSN